MSKVSYFLIALIITALLFMGAVRGYQFYEKKAAQLEAERAANQQTFSFQNVPLQLAPEGPEPVSRPVLFSERKQDIFLEEAPLNNQQEVQQAQDTIESILADFREDPNLQAFNKDLKDATDGNAVDLRGLSHGNLSEILQQNPEISAVVTKHMQNPDFAKTIEQIFSNPQFVESIQALQRQQLSEDAKKSAK